MRKIFSFMMVSVDGYFEGKNHELDWHIVDAEFNVFAREQLVSVDTLLFGSRTYELMARYWPTERAQADDPAIVHLMNSTSKIVFSRESIRADWSNTRLITEHAIDELAKMKIQPGGNMCVLGSSNLCVSLMQANLIDEWRVMINPVLLGRGNTVYDGITDRLRLKHTGTKIFKSGNVLLYYCQT